MTKTLFGFSARFSAAATLLTILMPFTAAYASSNNPSCTLDADDSHIQSGDSTTLRWTMDNADDAWITNIGTIDVGDSGSRDTDDLYHTTTFTLTVQNDDGDTDSCSTTVYVDGDNTNCGYNNYDCSYQNYATNGQRPYCTISVRSYAGGNGNTTNILSWNSSYANRAYLNPDVGSVAVDGTYTRTSRDYNPTYTLTVYGDGGSAQCSTNGGYANPYSYQSPQYQYPYVTLTQIPYTGIGWSDIGAALYFAALLSFALAGSYLVVYYRGGMQLADVKIAARNQVALVKRALGSR